MQFRGLSLPKACRLTSWVISSMVGLRASLPARRGQVVGHGGSLLLVICGSRWSFTFNRFL
jgi:hypothetical protein